MNKVRALSTGLMVLSLSAVCNNTLANNYPVELENNLKSVCQHAAENNRLGLHQTIQQISPGHRVTGPTYRVLAEGLLCNGVQVANFARQYGATDTMKAFQRYTPARQVIEIRDIEISKTLPSDIQVSFAIGK
ncbi:DUF3718 domain-containing protein [Alteromonas facilis]|uniref:DUF3718 domain-containing protein n=1 Tax=Alteromonas facilis TaxID=2048004 RepID=UPI0013DD3AEB|nr:DUF3718 domain-containing protein [Alteromonas facilis]